MFILWGLIYIYTTWWNLSESIIHSNVNFKIAEATRRATQGPGTSEESWGFGFISSEVTSSHLHLLFYSFPACFHKMISSKTANRPVVFVSSNSRVRVTSASQAFCLRESQECMLVPHALQTLMMWNVCSWPSSPPVFSGPCFLGYLLLYFILLLYFKSLLIFFISLFLSLSIIGILKKFKWGREHPVHCRIFSCAPGFYTQWVPGEPFLKTLQSDNLQIWPDTHCEAKPEDQTITSNLSFHK